METRYKPRGFPQRLGSLRLPLFPQPRRRYYLPAINLGVGPFYSIKVGSFYVVKASQTSLPMECPYCNGMWLKPVRQNPVAKVPEIEFINQIRMMIKNQHAPVELRFEFKDEEVARSSPS